MEAEEDPKDFLGPGSCGSTGTERLRALEVVTQSFD
jgi:hypothetical protein